MMAALCPEGATSTVFALLTSVQMAGSTLAGSLSSALTHALGVRLGDYSNLGALTLVTAAVRLSTLFFVGLVPTKTTRALQAETDGSGRLLSSTASSDKAADHSVERDGAVAADGRSECRNGRAMSNASPQQRAFSFVQLEDAQSTSNSSGASSESAAHAHSHARGRRYPFGALLLFSMIVGSLTWSLVTMFSHL